MPTRSCRPRGGWARQFTLGRVTLDHGGIDCFTWADGADALARELIRLGYAEVAGPPPGLQRDFAQDGLESSSTLIDRNHSLTEGARSAGRATRRPSSRPVALGSGVTSAGSTSSRLRTRSPGPE